MMNRRIVMLLVAGGLVAGLGCETATPAKNAGTLAAVKPGEGKKGAAEAKTADIAALAKTFDKRLAALTPAQRTKYDAVRIDISLGPGLLMVKQGRLRNLVADRYNVQGQLNGLVNYFQEPQPSPEHFDRRIDIHKQELQGIRKSFDEQKAVTPDTPSTLALYRASRVLLDGLERQLDEVAAPLKTLLSDPSKSVEEKKAEFESMRQELMQEALAWDRERRLAIDNYNPQVAWEFNEIALRMARDPAYKPVCTVPTVKAE